MITMGEMVVSEAVVHLAYLCASGLYLYLIALVIT